MLLLDRLIASDPAQERSRFALRALSAITLTGMPLFPLIKVGIVPGPVVLLGVLVAMWSSFSANDPLLYDRKVTAALLPSAAALGITLCTLLDTLSPVAGAIAFLCVCFPAIWVRRFGPRWNGLGMMALFGCFFTNFLMVTLPQLPAALLATALGGAIAWVVRFYLVTDAPHLVLRVASAAFRSQLCLLVHATEEASPGRSDIVTGRVRSEVLALNRAALVLDQLANNDGLELPTASRDTLRERLLHIERVADDGALRDAPFDVTALLAQTKHIERELQCARENGKGDIPISGNPTPPDIGPIASTTRQAIQITAATTSAMLLGTLVPPHQYFWAVLTAFIVYNRTSSASEARRRSFARAAGTVVGVGVALGAVQLMRGHAVIECIVAFVSLVAALYAFRASYFAFTFFLSTLVGMLYDVVGRPADQLLVTRLIETLIGAVCGSVAATWLLPLQTDAVILKAAQAYLHKLVACCRAAVSPDTPARAQFLDRARELDTAHQALVARASPLADRREAPAHADIIAVLESAFEASLAMKRLIGAVESTVLDAEPDYSAITSECGSLGKDPDRKLHAVAADIGAIIRATDRILANTSTARPAAQP